MDASWARGPFDDRADAGRRLAGALQSYRDGDALVVGLARGGVEVAAAVAEALNLPLRALVVRKVGAPHNPELAIGAVSETGVQWIDQSLLEPTGATPGYVSETVSAQIEEAHRQQREYSAGPLGEAVRGRPVILVDDGIATGATALVAIRSARELGASSVILATPLASGQAINTLRPHVDRLIVLMTPDPFGAVGLHYRRFDQLGDERVIRLLRAAEERTPDTYGDSPPIQERAVTIPAGAVTLPALLALPEGAQGIVLFAHGSGSGRLSPRNNAVARVLNRARLATLLADLLTEEEAADRRKVFDIGLLADRLAACAAYAGEQPSSRPLPAGYFGASTGGAAAIVAASREGSPARAVVSRGGRPDLAAEALERVRCPTLLIVGGEDKQVLALNRHAYDRLHTEKRLAVIPGATHLFEEPGALDAVAELARDWFLRYLPG
jgi:putative phosphoribosyl transferase